MKNTLLGLLTVGILGLAGCNIFAPPEAAVLEGSWRATFEEAGDLEGIEIILSFNSNGELTSIDADSDEGGSASLDVDNATTEVDGNAVTITIPTEAGNTIFEGTLSEDENTIEGDLSQEIEIPGGDLEVTLPNSGVTLERLNPE